jgi:uncharacterized protein (DUF885 family)
MRIILRSLVLLLTVNPVPVLAANDYASLVQLANDWRAFERPAVNHCVPDYGSAAMQAKAAGLPALRERLAGIESQGWPSAQIVDYQLIEAEMNGLDFDLRVRRPWARDPSFYETVIGERSDVPQHEGDNAAPTIDLYAYSFPLKPADQQALTCALAGIPALLEQAKVNLHDSDARDLWVYSVRSLREQSELLKQLQAGSLDMRTLEGPNHADLAHASRALLASIQRARAATDGFIDWLNAEAPSKTGPSGVGKENYNWYVQKVHLVPYDWDQQETLLRRELERAQASLRTEEFRNRDLPPAQSADTPAVFNALSVERMKKLSDFLIQSGIVPDKDYYRDAMAKQALSFTPPEQRNFFLKGAALEPLALYSHDYHWIELARMKYEPNQSPIRRLPALSNMFDARSEGLATAMEETLMQAGLYNGDPRGREVVWVMLANRAARGLASLYVQANEMTLQQAGRFHAQWTPRGWSDPNSDLVAFEQLLYLRQPGYGTSYIVGKLQFERLMAEYAHAEEAAGKTFSLSEFFARMNSCGTIPFALIESELMGEQTLGAEVREAAAH